MTPEELKHQLGQGLLSFPITDFHADLSFNAKSYASRLEWLLQYDAAGLFAAGGTGEFFSLAPDEYGQVIKTATDVCGARMPIIAGTGFSTRIAVQLAQEAERNGAAGLLLLPHYLTEASQDGMEASVKAVCQAVSIGVVIYNRSVCRFSAETLTKLAECCPNLIGFKDGVGDIEQFMTIYHKLGDRFVYLGGLPTAELFAPAYLAMGVNTYSSAVFNFIPETALRYYKAMRENDTKVVNDLLRRFFFPLIALRNRKAGYAVSMIKAGAEIVGHGGGPVRPPLTALEPADEQTLRQLIQEVGGK